MKRIKVDEIKGDEILARDIVTDAGYPLMMSGTPIRKEYIEKLKNLSIHYVYIEEKIVEQEFKSVEAIQKLAKSIGETMIEHKQFTQDFSRESRNSRDNIETSKAISEMMSKDLDIIVRKLNAISELAEGMIKHEEE